MDDVTTGQIRTSSPKPVLGAMQARTLRPLERFSTLPSTPERGPGGGIPSPRSSTDYDTAQVSSTEELYENLFLVRRSTGVKTRLEHPLRSVQTHERPCRRRNQDQINGRVSRPVCSRCAKAVARRPRAAQGVVFAIRCEAANCKLTRQRCLVCRRTRIRPHR